MPHEFLARYRINLAKLFLGMDGGYSLESLKKLYLKEKKLKGLLA
jgi:hypothetical protein